MENKLALELLSILLVVSGLLVFFCIFTTPIATSSFLVGLASAGMLLVSGFALYSYADKKYSN